MVSQTAIIVALGTLLTLGALYGVHQQNQSELINLVDDSPNTAHYEDPKPNGCQSDEEAIQVQGVAGDFCSPKCTGNTCPSDVPSGVTATPTCALKTPTGDQYCALICTPEQNDSCGAATCKAIQGVGLCTYDD